MTLLVLGINHKTASVDLREKVAFSPQKLTDALTQLAEHNAIASSVIISTCNRTEVYVQMCGDDRDVLVDWLCEFHQLDKSALMPCVYLHKGELAVRHLMRVACGLDSLVLGEPQILGQVKQAYMTARDHHTVKGTLEKLFHRTFAVAKRVRTETAIGSNAVSVAFAACMLARQIFESLADATIMVIGAGETIELVTRHIIEHGGSKLIVANRTVERAEKIISQFQGKAISLNDIPDYLHQADIVISSTASPLPIVGKGMVEEAMKKRRSQPMLLVDIAVPRDIESQVGDLDDVYLYTVDDLHSIVEQNREQRRIEAIQAETIVKDESAQFVSWLHSLSAVDSIRQYRLQANSIKDDLMSRSLQALANGVSPEKVLAELSNKLTNKLIHAPTRAMQVAAHQRDDEKLSVIRESVGLNPFSH